MPHTSTWHDRPPRMAEWYQKFHLPPMERSPLRSPFASPEKHQLKKMKSTRQGGSQAGTPNNRAHSSRAAEDIWTAVNYLCQWLICCLHHRHWITCTLSTKGHAFAPFSVVFYWVMSLSEMVCLSPAKPAYQHVPSPQTSTIQNNTLDLKQKYIHVHFSTAGSQSSLAGWHFLKIVQVLIFGHLHWPCWDDVTPINAQS